MYGGQQMAGQQPDYQGLWKRYQQGPDKFAVGNKVYNGGTNSPHSGPGLDPSGFQQRDQLAMMKRAYLMNQLNQGGF